MVNFDVALQKNLPVTESKSLQFRVESRAVLRRCGSGWKYQRGHFWADREQHAAAVDAGGDVIGVLARAGARTLPQRPVRAADHSTGARRQH